MTMLVIIALGVVISYWSICAATIDLSNTVITETEQDQLSELEYRELVPMLYSELNKIKEEQKATIMSQNKLLTRVNEFETKHITLQRQFENVLDSCGREKTSESNLKADFQLQSHGNVTERTIASTTDKRTGETKTGMVREVEPKQIAFLARQANDMVHYANGHIIMFDTVNTNLGNAYSPHNGIFRAPVAGLYIVLFTVAASDVKSPDVEVVHNGLVICRAVVAPGMYTGSSCNAIIHLDAGDNVWARILNASPPSKIRGLLFSTFSIGKLSSD